MGLRQRDKQRGFTLIELIIVIVILGILSVVAIPKFIDLKDDAGLAAAEGVAGALAAGSAINYAKKLADKTYTTLTAANVCTDLILGPLLQSGATPSGFTIGGTGDCSGAAESVTCTVTHTDTGQVANTEIICAP